MKKTKKPNFYYEPQGNNIYRKTNKDGKQEVGEYRFNPGNRTMVKIR